MKTKAKLDKQILVKSAEMKKNNLNSVPRIFFFFLLSILIPGVVLAQSASVLQVSNYTNKTIYIEIVKPDASFVTGRNIEPHYSETSNAWHTDDGFLGFDDFYNVSVYSTNKGIKTLCGTVIGGKTGSAFLFIDFMDIRILTCDGAGNFNYEKHHDQEYPFVRAH